MLTEDEIRSFLAGGNNSKISIKKVEFPTLEQAQVKGNVKVSMSHLEDVQVEITAELGQVEKKTWEILELSEGSIIKLNNGVGNGIAVFMNQKQFAKGEVVIVNDNFGVHISEVNHGQKLKLTEKLL
ncbi:MAG: flagellar motor switch protein FliN [Peptococcaceae bacterium]|nr:flagellar motor switch protein FliN [Candidatus Syntrophopropionicum ammoniitolerans]